MKKLTIILLLAFQSIFAQDVKPDGFTVFYYGNGQKSSEGMMQSGKPNGFWKTYYVNGILKTEGKRTNFLLDSIWNFYDTKGNITEKISYFNGHKNGYYLTYEFDTATQKSWLKSKELLVNDKKQGEAFYYYPNGKLQQKVKYENNRKEGIALEFSEDSLIISILDYRNDFPISREKLNRKDSRGLKQDTWKQFYPNLRVKVEENYMNDKLNGYYREFDENGKVTKIQRFENGNLVDEKAQDNSKKVEIKNEYHASGKLQKSGSFVDGVPVGFHREFDENEEVISTTEYNENGVVIGIGLVDNAGNMQKYWKHYYETGELKSEGEYKSNKKDGKWIFYYKSGEVEQKGTYRNGSPVGHWIWLYENGKLQRDETFVNGKEEGTLTEYDKEGNILTKGDYYDGLEEGEWFYKVGDDTKKGAYKSGLQDGLWKEYYSNEKLKFVGSFILGEPDGKHKYYYDNGQVSEEGAYVMGAKNGNWKQYDREGLLKAIITYDNGIETRIDGVKIKNDKPEKEEKR